jgi:hypothetical protein
MAGVAILVPERNIASAAIGKSTRERVRFSEPGECKPALATSPNGPVSSDPSGYL